MVNTQNIALAIYFGNTKTLGIGHLMTKNCRFTLLLGGQHRLLQHSGKALSIEYIIAENKANTILADKLLSDNKSLRQAIW